MPISRWPAPRPDSVLVELWSLRHDTLVELPDDNCVDRAAVLTTRWGDVRLPNVDKVVSTALERMSYGPVSLDNVVPGFSSPDRPPGPEEAELRKALHSVENVVVRSLAMDDGRPLLSVVPITRGASFHPQCTRADTTHRLSRFASLRAGDGGLWVESPLSDQRVVLHRLESSWLLSCFALPSTAQNAALWLRMPVETVRLAIAYLEASGMLVRESSPGGRGCEHVFAEDHDPALQSWSPHDLMLHSRSRLGRHDGPVGATYEHTALLDGEPAAGSVPAAGRSRITLPVPDLDRVLRHDPPFTVVLEARASLRAQDQRPLELARLGELLYRTARVRSVGTGEAEGDGHGGGGGDGDRRGSGNAVTGADGAGAVTSASAVSDRPYPSTGGVHALELYLTVSNCERLARGCYRYDPVEHALVDLDTAPRGVDELLAEARAAAGLAGEPAVLITMTARFRRMTARYSGLAYSALLKDVGVLQQTFYLVCTAMGLAPCALAMGDSDLSARAFGLDWRTESGIGEFVLGVLPAGEGEALPQGRPGPARPTAPAATAESGLGLDWRIHCSEALRSFRAAADD